MTLGADAVDDGTEDPQTFTYDLFTLKRNNIGDTLGDRKLQDVYGISADEGGVPSFNFVNAIVSGQRINSCSFCCGCWGKFSDWWYFYGRLAIRRQWW